MHDCCAHENAVPRMGRELATWPRHATCGLREFHDGSSVFTNNELDIGASPEEFQ